MTPSIAHTINNNHFEDSDYPAIECDCIDSSMSANVDYLKGCAWMCGKLPVCACGDFVEPSLYCRKCGHEVDCHQTVRVVL